MNILRRELRGGLRSLLVWTLIVGAYNFGMMALQPSFALDAQKIEELMSVFPEAMIKAFGMDRLSMADPLGFYATEVYLMVILFGSIFAALLGAGILAKEEDEKTIEFLLAKPVSRVSMLWQKVLAVTISLVVFNCVVSLLTFAAFAVFVDRAYSTAALLKLSIAPLFAHMAFASIGFLSALFFTRRRAVYSVSIGVAVGSYFIGLMSLLSDRLGWLRWISPTRYVEAVDIVVDGLKLSNLAILVAVSVICLAAAFTLYRRRDITV